MKSVLLSIISFITINSNAEVTVEKSEFSSEGLEQLAIKNMSGNVKISTIENGNAIVTAKKIKFNKNCEMKVLKEANQLKIEVEQKGWFNFSDCKVDFDIAIPAQMALKLKSGSGDLSVNGVEGDIEFDLGSGDIELVSTSDNVNGNTGSGQVKLSGQIGNSKVKTGSGDIEISGLENNANLRTGSGDIDLKFNKAPETGMIDVKTGSGDIDMIFAQKPTLANIDIMTGSGDAKIVLPEGTKLFTNYKSGSGKLYNEFGEDPQAQVKLSMKAGSGDLKIKKVQ